ncbi:MAG: DUF5060 domain-containing protein [bacterium]|nr:DUF5060 domain-containing protein [bacterium]
MHRIRNFILIAPFIVCVQLSAMALGQYELFETFIPDQLEYENPFDSSSIQVDAHIQREGGEAVTVPCFYDDSHRWGLRFTPDQTGDYRYTVSARTGGDEIELASGEFGVEPREAKGFIRVGESGRHFVFDNSQSYFPLGENMGWVSRNSSDWVSYLDQCGKSGVNWIRVWMCSWGYTELVWTPMGGRYHGLESYDLDNARLWDAIFLDAEQRGINIQMVINHHGQYSSQTNPIWDENPYNAANGGYLQKPQDFFTDERAKKDYRDRLRYLVARWGCFTNLLCWEFWNEVDLTSGFDMTTVKNWHAEMSKYLRSIDPYNHLQTTSTSSIRPEIFTTPGLDYAQSHAYVTDIINRQQEVSAMYARQQPGHPHIFGEMSYDWRGPNREDRDGVILHNQIWSSIHSNDAGTAMTWWWDNWVRPYNLYPIFKHAAEYIQDIDWERERLVPVEAQVEVVNGNRGDYDFTPRLGWSNTSRETFPIAQDGTVEGIGQCSVFVHGNAHRDMAPNPEFVINLDEPADFIIQLNRIARAGAILRIYLNDAAVESKVFAQSESDTTISGGEGRITVPLAEGQNRIKIRNIGNDWVELRTLTVTNFINRPVAYARGGNDLVLLWVQDREHRFAVIDRYPQYGDLKPSQVTLPSVKEGLWSVTRFDPYDGTQVNVGEYQAGENGLRFPLESFARDAAYRAVKVSAAVDAAEEYERP